MGEAKLKRKRLDKYMAEAQRHGADVHVPSDTEQFDKQAEPVITPEQEELMKRVTEVSQRFTAYANFICGRADNGPLQLLIQAYVQSIFNEAAQNAMNTIIMEKLEISKEDFRKAMVKVLEGNLFEMQAVHGVIITNREVVVMPKGESNSA